MDPLFKLTEVLPAPPGNSPFHARGIFYDQVLKHAANIPGGVPALLEQIRDEHVRAFMKQRFRWTEWYDAVPMVAVQAALCRVQGGEFESLVRKRSRLAAESLVPRMFRVVLGLGGPKGAAEHLPRLLLSHFDFGDVRINVKNSQGTGLVKAVPSILAPSYVNIVMGLIEGALYLMGAKAVEGGYSNVTQGEPLHGYETLTCQAAFRWTK